MSDQLELEILLANNAVDSRVTLADVMGNIKSEEYIVKDTLTICFLTLQNGFIVHGSSAAASPKNFNEEIGRKIAKENAVREIWPLMGYKLKEDLYKSLNPVNFVDRLKIEYDELNIKFKKLNLFILDSPLFNDLTDKNKDLLVDQRAFMKGYLDVLKERIKINP